MQTYEKLGVNQAEDEARERSKNESLWLNEHIAIIKRDG